jgi:hypothetical protein
MTPSPTTRTSARSEKFDVIDAMRCERKADQGRRDDWGDVKKIIRPRG